MANVTAGLYEPIALEFTIRQKYGMIEGDDILLPVGVGEVVMILVSLNN
ncbi:hypothetical protein MUG84_05080 [Paenibacillus sp. KQZ6P-2]|uniref:Uncharacterized protein n=1 Tax=Paenibacillus mangrovi TaxID=2931978 RepID=A0A9X2B4J7_9BACL|nr:hypothetical protein [Paenibacillus mangrovi]MCJ8011118.1 hypothetical protein [Paenibacillus mangrovi]